ncbi:hypothetical protein [Janthinobacterium sp. BJB401]|uniref:hypothetical protein n=1 Tax=Janthinobacterium sp. BJB401 TaxID=2745934 RepID=UPI0015953DFC|nr:hypothetical protein [Janthinobacterium sp. BJB401]NVI84166.1 hypothetical protein [Janthinobacterium sp. BJB401]
MSRPSYARYLSILTLVLLSCACLVCVFVYIVDPYNLYGVARRENFNAVKPGLERYQSQIKHEHALRLRPRFIILGNSRAEIGFDPRAAAFGAMQGAGYNMGIPGTGMATAISQFGQLTQAGIKPGTVIVGLEFIDFLTPAIAPPARAEAPSSHLPGFWRFDTLFSLASVKDAVKTPLIQHDKAAFTIEPSGLNPALDYGAHAVRDGYDKVFRHRAQKSAARFVTMSKTDFADGDFQSLHDFLLAMSATQADIKLVIYPYHAQMLTLFEGAGLWPLFEEWKQQVVQEVAAVKEKNPSASISVTDFSGFGPYNCEPIPTQQQRHASTRWYWEAGHFKKALGDIVMQRIMTQKGGAPDDGQFGMPLTSATLAANRDRIAAERRACEAAQPAMFALSKKLFEKSLERASIRR